MPARLDLYRTHRAEYVAPRRPVLVTTKPAKYLAVEGRSVPGAPEFDGSAAKRVWNWQLMIRTPDFITPPEVRKTKTALLKKGKPPTVAKVKLIKLAEGRCIQMLHVGPYDQEQPTLDAMHALAAEQSLSVKGRHHEIYLSDPRRVAPARLKTILRYSVR